MTRQVSAVLGIVVGCTLDKISRSASRMSKSRPILYGGHSLEPRGISLATSVIRDWREVIQVSTEHRWRDFSWKTCFLIWCSYHCRPACDGAALLNVRFILSKGKSPGLQEKCSKIGWKRMFWSGGGFAKTAFEDELRTWHPSTTIVSKTVDFGSWLMQAVWFQEPGRAWGWSKDFKALRRSSWWHCGPKIKLRRSLRNRAEHIMMSTLGAIRCRDTIFGIYSNTTQFPPTEEENTYFEHGSMFCVENKCFGFLSLWLPQWALISIFGRPNFSLAFLKWRCENRFSIKS